MDIRVGTKHIKEFQKLYEKSKADKAEVKLNYQADVEIPTIMISTTEGNTICWNKGYAEAKSVLIHGYNRIIKKCPYSFMRSFRCKGEKCQLYIVENKTGDCSMRWSGIIAIVK